jgi:hypothetical protein
MWHPFRVRRERGLGSGGLRTASPCFDRPANRFDACGIPLRSITTLRCNATYAPRF